MNTQSHKTPINTTTPCGGFGFQRNHLGGERGPPENGENGDEMRDLRDSCGITEIGFYWFLLVFVAD
jgi:hypothetical protein